MAQAKARARKIKQRRQARPFRLSADAKDSVGGSPVGHQEKERGQDVHEHEPPIPGDLQRPKRWNIQTAGGQPQGAGWCRDGWVTPLTGVEVAV